MDQSLALSAPRQDTAAARDVEAEWIEAARTTPAAFEPLYLRYRERIHHYLRLRLPSDEDAADATQEVFLQALKALPHYQPRGIPVAAWLFRIAHHLAVNQRRRQRQWVSWDALPEQLHPASGPDLETLVQRQEVLGQLKIFLATLKPTERELLALRYAAGLSAPEIAAVLGKQPAAVRKQLSRLLQSFKEHYNDEHHE